MIRIDKNLKPQLIKQEKNFHRNSAKADWLLHKSEERKKERILQNKKQKKDTLWGCISQNPKSNNEGKFDFLTRKVSGSISIIHPKFDKDSQHTI